MNRLIKESLENLLQETSGSKRLGRRIIGLAGFLDAPQAPESVQRQLGTLSRLLILQDAFDELLEPVTLMARSGLTHTPDPHALQTMFSSVEEARKKITELDEVNYAHLIGWLVSNAQSRQIMRASKGQDK